MSIPYRVSKPKYSKTHCGRIGTCIFATHLGHASTFCVDKVLPKPHDCENMGPQEYDTLAYKASYT